VALAVSPADYLEAQRWRCDLQAAFAAVFRHADLIITPTVPALSKVIGQDRIGDSHYRTVLSWYSALVNHAGCPAISLPLRASGAPPPSVQMIAPWWREDLLLGLAATLEEAGVVGFSAPPLYAS
jgi:aspartyl-tRNA(Asn)/glutamyl-tRNA(Gln) amidotransferase subunit A